MDVDATSFPNRLLGILVNISESDFVSFDLELSGIPNRMPGKVWKRGRQTLAERYAETKEGAERYHILQFGFTWSRVEFILLYSSSVE